MEETIYSIGELLAPDSPALRDAVHIAVYPATAGETLQPGEHVKFTAEGLAVSTFDRHRGVNGGVGVVDPYLAAPVDKGDRFWIFMYPMSVVNLRHSWYHPQIREPAPPGAGSSEKWLRDFANDYSIDYDKLIREATQEAEDGGRHVVFASDSGYSAMADARIAASFWSHLEVVTGRVFNEDHREKTWFSCSC